MGPQDHLRALLDGIDCTVCEERVPTSRVRLLARRDELIFLQIDCSACGSTSLGFIADPAVGSEAEHLEGGPAISSDDVLDMHAFLDTWTGDLTSLLGSSDGPRIGPARPGDRRGRSA